MERTSQVKTNLVYLTMPPSKPNFNGKPRNAGLELEIKPVRAHLVNETTSSKVTNTIRENPI